MGNPKNPRKRKPRTLRTETYGKGSVYQDGKGIWWYQPPAKDGLRLPRVRAASEQSARLAQKDHLAKLDQGVAVSDIPTVQAWFTFWLREYIAPDIDESSLVWYRYLIEHYILPAIGDMLINQVTSDHLIVLRNELRKRLSLRTVTHVHDVLDRAFKKATVSRKIPFNPMDALERPRVPRSPQKAMAPEHVVAFRNITKGHPYELLYDLMFLQGFRKGEALGLLISEYDADRAILKVSGQIQSVGSVTRRKGKTKSPAGIREVPVTPRQQGLFEIHLQRIADRRKRLGLDWKEHGLLFPSGKGIPIIPRNLNRNYDALQIAAGIPHYTLHALRHTSATVMDTVRASKSQQRAIMGHSPGDVTENYIHPPLDELRAVLLASEREYLRWAA